MADDAAIRLKNFRALWDRQKWSPSLLSANCGGVASLWSDLYHGRKKSFGEKLARKIEDGMKLVRLSLDEPDGASLLTARGAPAPAAPPPGFQDRRLVSESEWGLLQAVKLVVPLSEQREILERAEQLETVVQERIAKYRAEPSDPKG